MSKARLFGAGAGGTQYGVLTSVNQGGGNKKQGLVSTTNTRVDLNALIRIRGGGHNRNWLFCMNQLGGVGRRWGQASGPGNRGGVSANCQRLAYRRRQQYPPKPCGAQVRGWGAGVKFPPLCSTTDADQPTSCTVDEDCTARITIPPCTSTCWCEPGGVPPTPGLPCSCDPASEQVPCPAGSGAVCNTALGPFTCNVCGEDVDTSKLRVKCNVAQGAVTGKCGCCPLDPYGSCV